jgi:hypothetical protein
MSAKTFIATGLSALADGRLVTVRREGSLQHLIDASSGEPIVGWTSPRARDCAVAGDKVVVVCEGNYVYTWNCETNTGSLAKIHHDSPGRSSRVALVVGGGNVVMTGDRGICVQLSPADGSYTVGRLGEYGIERPGRDVLGSVQCGDGGYFLGANGLIVEFGPQGVRELAKSTRSEVGLISGVRVGEMLWCAGHIGAKAVLMSVSTRDDAVQIHEVPNPVPRAMHPPLIAHIGDELLVIGSGVCRGVPGAWRRVSSTRGEDAVGVRVDDAKARLSVIEGNGDYWSLPL